QSADMTDAEAFAAVEAASDLRDAMSQVELLRSPEAWPGIDLQPVSLMEPVTNGHPAPVVSDPVLSFESDDYDAMSLAPVVASTEALFAGPWDSFADADDAVDEPEEGDWSVVAAPEHFVEPAEELQAETIEEPLAAETEAALQAVDADPVGEPEVVA